MTHTYGIAGQAKPASNVDHLLFQVPVNTQFVSSVLTICNLAINGSIANYSIALVPSGETLADKHYVVYEEGINSRSEKPYSRNFTLGPGDMVFVRSSTGTLSFTLCGDKITS